jgi:membrane-bound lytic murein transglycosylase D
MVRAQSVLGPILALLLLGPGAVAVAGAEPAPNKAKPQGKSPPGSLPEVKPASSPRDEPKVTKAKVTPPGPSPTQGTRKLEPLDERTERALPETPVVGKPKGPAPAKPEPRLPPGTPKPLPDESVRQKIQGGPAKPAEDAELSNLRAAERVLFPRPLLGVKPGWSWDLPRPEGSGTEVSATGLPSEGRADLLTSPSRGADVEWLKGLTLPNLPVRYDDRVLKYLRFYRDSPSGRSIARAWAKKSGRYGQALRTALVKAGLPSDLVFLSLIESGHNPAIYSSAGAAGLWQFMPDTARAYGLTVDRWVDERLDPIRATEAATKLLADLYQRFGTWDLAMAAYNMGHGGLARAIKKFNTNDFWELSRHEAGIPWETTLYVPKILATAILMNNRGAFGIEGIDADPEENFDSVVVGHAVSLDDVARVGGLTPEALAALNPQYRAGRTPPLSPSRPARNFRVRVPAGLGEKLQRDLNVDAAGSTLGSYVVRQGDTVSSIAIATASSDGEIRNLNRIAAEESLKAGTPLFVPRRTKPASPKAPTTADVVVVAQNATPPHGTVRVFYPVAEGDTLATISSAFGVERADLLAWNAVDEAARLQEGMVLQVFPPKGVDLTKVHYLKDDGTRTLVAGSVEFIDHFEGLNGKRRLLVAAKNGDTLAGIGKRYAMSVGWMERVNRRSRSDKLAAGDKVIVYAPMGAKAQAAAKKASAPVAAIPGSLPSIETLARGETRADGPGKKN